MSELAVDHLLALHPAALAASARDRRREVEAAGRASRVARAGR